jgi:hypothetical protein
MVILSNNRNSPDELETRLDCPKTDIFIQL